MSISLFGLIAAGLGGLALLAPYSFAVWIMTGLTLFQTASAVSLPGGATILAANLFLLFYVLRIVKRCGPSAVATALLPPSAGFWLLLLGVYCVLSAIFFPRLMAGMTETVTIHRSADGQASLELQPLYFNALYVTQSVYLLGGIVAFATSFVVGRMGGGNRYLQGAIFLLFTLHIAFAALDLVTYLAGASHLMGFMRNADYALLTGVEKAGLKRIAGAFSEASAFASFSLTLLAISASLWLDRLRPVLTGPISIVLLGFLILSTSATALIGLAILTATMVLREASAPIFGRRIRRPLALTAIAVGLTTVLLAIPLVMPSLAEASIFYLQDTLFGKLDSASGRERMLWNEVAFQNFLDTFGFGVGIGGARASSYLLVLLSNVGWPGFSLFALFVGTVLLRRNDRNLPRDEAILIRALRSGIVATLIGAAVAGAMFDLGLLFYIMAGAAAAASFAKFGEQAARADSERTDLPAVQPPYAAEGPLP